MKVWEFRRGLRDLQIRDQVVFARVRDRLAAEAPHAQPGSISYLALGWQWLLDELNASTSL